MLLTIAAGNSRLTVGGDGVPNGILANARTAGSIVAEHAKSLFFEGGGRPVSVDRGGYGGGFLSQLHLRCETPADCYFFRWQEDNSRRRWIARLFIVADTKGWPFTLLDCCARFGSSESLDLRTFALLSFFMRLIVSTHFFHPYRATPEDRTRQAANISESILSAVQRDLISLRTFVDQYASFPVSPPSLLLLTRLTSLPGSNSSLSHSPRVAEQAKPQLLTTPSKPRSSRSSFSSLNPLKRSLSSSS